jgi:hypothetical protein
MSRHVAFRRQPVDQQFEQQLRTLTLPAPTRGIVQNENDAFMQPGGAVVCDNWRPTLRGVKLRGGCVRYCDLHALDVTAWANNTAYVAGNRRYDTVDGSVWDCAVNNTSAASGTFADDRTARPTLWVKSATPLTRLPVISAFEYASGSVAKMFAGNATKLYDVTVPTPVLIKSGQTSGNYSAAQLANASGNWMIVVNEAGDAPLRFNGTTWETADPFASNPITGPVGTPVVAGHGLGFVWKYRRRLFFIGAGTMSAWYLSTNDAVGGALLEIPLAGAAALGGKLTWGATWSMDAGDGLDEKCIFGTDQGEVLIFTGTDPGNAANWRQEGRYFISAPLGMNAHLQVGGDMLVATVQGIVPLSQAITKSSGQLDLALLTRTIEPMWHDEVAAKRSWAWSMKAWDDYSAIFVTTPGDAPGQRHCLLAHETTGAWARYVGWDATCFARMRADMYFGTQDGWVMQAERTGRDDVFDPSRQAMMAVPYVATLVGGWEMFGAPANTIVWHQARAAFRSAWGEPFQPQLSATVDYVVTLPTPPAAGNDPGLLDVWDQGVWGPDAPWAVSHLYAVNDIAWDTVEGTAWRVVTGHTSAASGTFAADRAGAAAGKWAAVTTPTTTPAGGEMAAYAQWDQPAPTQPPVRNTLWISIGQTGFAHAPIAQVTVAQMATPNVELLAISATYEPAGVNV